MALRNVDTFEDEEDINIEELIKQLETDNKEIIELENEIKEQLKILGLNL